MKNNSKSEINIRKFVLNITSLVNVDQKHENQLPVLEKNENYIGVCHPWTFEQILTAKEKYISLKKKIKIT